MAKILRKNLTSFLRTRGAVRSRELCAQFGVKQQTMSGALIAASREILKIGGGSRTRYALRREIGTLGNSWPIFRVDSAGMLSDFGRLHAIFGENSSAEFAFVPAAGIPHETFAALVGEEFADGIFPDLPWFLADHRPRGFLGREIAAKLARERTDFPENVGLWPAETILRYWLEFGGDIAGALIVGETARERFLSGTDAGAEPLAEDARAEAFPRLCERALAGTLPFSSAAGEQPKFVAAVRGGNGEIRQVLVKFSGDISAAAGRRTADLLIAEKTASDLLGAAGFRVPRTEILFAGGRCFLESARIDRCGARGRIFTVSLEAIDAAFLGENGANPWPEAVARGAEFGLFSESDAAKVRELYEFGRAIGNTDMHFGNLSFELAAGTENSAAGTPAFRLAPVYDMLPAAYAPQSDLTSLRRDAVGGFPADALSRERATEFWKTLSADARVSGDFRAVAARNFEKFSA